MTGNDTEATSNWITSQNLRAFKGKWIVVVNRKIVHSGRNLPPLVEKARAENPGAVPFVYRVPEDATIVV